MFWHGRRWCRAGMGKTGMSTQNWIDSALAGNPVWSIGQIDKETARALDNLVKAGALMKSRASWMNISQLKTVWHLPNATA